ncbi:MAG: class I SAM-dependent methyltransferase [Candidatus Xenobia bacterium]
MESILGYYQTQGFNPVPLDVESSSGWTSQVAKRRNLYERHLHVPMRLLRNAEVLEFGCNSGENALVLAHYGAKLTLVEPNQAMMPRLQKIFEQRGLQHQIVSLSHQGIETFESDRQFDLVVAEGFLYMLPERDNLLRRLCRFLAPDGIGIISSDDRIGTLAELIKILTLRRVNFLRGFESHSSESLNAADELFGEDFRRIPASRPFAAWWQDMLVNPHVPTHLWSFEEILAALEDEGCEFLACSPRWMDPEAFNWYKRVKSPRERHQSLLDAYPAYLSYFLTGRAPIDLARVPAPAEVVTQVGSFVTDLIQACVGEPTVPDWPNSLDAWLSQYPDSEVQQWNRDTKVLLEALGTADPTAIRVAWKSGLVLRRWWGSVYHYVSFVRRA